MTVFNKTIIVEIFILMTHQSSPTLLTASRRPNLLWLAALVAAIIGLGYLWWVQPLPTPMPPPTQVTSLQGPVMATMDSPVFHYAQPWQLSPTGADPAEPADPWLEPAGALRFTYTGAELALLLAPGDYWGSTSPSMVSQPTNCPYYVAMSIVWVNLVAIAPSMRRKGKPPPGQRPIGCASIVPMIAGSPMKCI